MYVTVSPECMDYSVAGKQAGSDGMTGWQLPDVALVLLEIEPMMLRIENSSNAPQVLNGKDILTLKQGYQPNMSYTFSWGTFLQLWRLRT